MEEAARALLRGELVIVPTETVYGLAADGRVPGAVERIFAAKGRPDDKPVPWLAAGVEEVRKAGARVDGAAGRLARRYWPGPLTLVLDTPDGAKGFRVPAYAAALALLRRVGGVLAVTSANRSGEAPALTAQDALRALGETVAVVLDAGPSPGGVPSTVVKVEQTRIHVLREGAISKEEILGTAGGEPGVLE